MEGREGFVLLRGMIVFGSGMMWMASVLLMGEVYRVGEGLDEGWKVLG